MSVATWPTFLLRDVPESLRSRISADAASEDTSVADVIRRLLCARYHLDCPPESPGYIERPAIRPTVLLRLQPDLKGELFLEAERTGRPVRRIILDTLANHYTLEILALHYDRKDH